MIRRFKPEDAEYIINSHYKIYNKEYNYDLSFKEFIKKGLNNFIERSDTTKEEIWILEINGVPKGSIGITMVDENVAQLRWFLVEPDLRGSGFGSKLIQKAIDFCREKAYKTILLWTNNDFKAARNLYKKFGFRLTETRIQTLSNQILTEERWELSL
ncbi:GNAT family N-acetyltransferase [Thermaerobacillus caldiproteolyticus]|uniref:GNAT family N-acetyltransferase n=1 Tax=Thermaerobacillus caldiproteolyticus TaxID=247480 RepID=UPI0018F26AD6|nr:GNAT family N-acetyltransferase [Anoxybacillus caldiproteolyticus]